MPKDHSMRQQARMMEILSLCNPAMMPATLQYCSLQTNKNRVVAQGGAITTYKHPEYLCYAMYAHTLTTLGYVLIAVHASKFCKEP